MSYTYIKDIKCFGCGGTELEQQHILNGFTRCACKTCGSKFIVQCEGSDVVDKYIADRGIISAAMETAVIDERELNDVPDELKNLVNKYSAIVDLDPVYHWYKIVLLTNNFKDFTKFKEAEREYKKVSESYVVCATDKTLTDSYERVYKSYCHEYFKQQDIVNNRKKKKKKKALAFSLIGILIIIISVILSVSLYIPSLKDEKTGIRVKLNNK
ncbi:MAG: hypothetical protein K2N23_05600, partial [Clostridia bacterium]|nr:hypothetical protein [Clostridia bacterium]